MRVHREAKEEHVFELAVAKGGAKLRAHVDEPLAAPAVETGTLKLDQEGFAVFPKNCKWCVSARANGDARLTSEGLTMSEVASTMGYKLHAMVFDKMGLMGRYDFSVISSINEPGSDPVMSLVAAMETQLGLRFESEKGPVQILVVDNAQKIPTEN